MIKFTGRRLLRVIKFKKAYILELKKKYKERFLTPIDDKEDESIEEVSLWMNKKLTDLSFLLQFPNLKKIIISNQKKVEIIPDLTGLAKLEEIYFLEKHFQRFKLKKNSLIKILWKKALSIKINFKKVLIKHIKM